MGKRHENGQVIVLMVVGIITLLGFSALAIDGARLFSERRNLQGVCDTAAMTAAGYIGQFTPSFIHNNFKTNFGVEPRAEQAALEIIRANGYIDDVYNPFGGNDRLYIDVAPVSPSRNEFTSYHVIVKMISEVDPIFAQLVYHEPIMANADTEVIFWPKMNMAYGRALFSTATDGARRIELTGDSEINILNSGIFASSIDSQAIYISGSSSAYIYGDVTSVGGVDYSFGLLVQGTGIVQENAQPLPLAPIPTPSDCSSLSTSVETYDPVSGITWHTPGRIITPTNISTGHHIFQSGWYCITEDFQISGGIVETETTGAMFYIQEGDTNFNISAGLTDLRAAQNGEANDIAENVWDGMLIYMDQSNIGTVSIKPDPGSYLEGTIYAPGPPQNDSSPKCSIHGSGLTDILKVQFICYSITMTGNSGLSMEFESTMFYESPITMNLEE
jgi:hypothetical protein